MTGSSGKLGSSIYSSNLVPDILAPSRVELDITKPHQLDGFFLDNTIDAVIHCAALARMSECHKNPELAIETNIIGTYNLIKAVVRAEKSYKKKIRFIHISTDGVYEGITGDYSETSETRPYNTYGWTKLAAEDHVKKLQDYCILRTRFFDPNNISFESAATDIFSSSLPLKELVQIIADLLFIDFKGVLNIGGQTLSDYERYKIYKPTITPTTKKNISKDLEFKIATNSSLDLNLMKKIISREQ